MGRPRKSAIEGEALAPASGVEFYSPEIEIVGHNSKNGLDAIGFDEVNAKALEIEREQYAKGILVTAIFFDGGQDHWIGNHCECPILPGSPAVRLHTGEIISL